MVPAVHNFWLGIMAFAFAGAMTVWIWLVLRADKHPHGYPQDTQLRREVLGGAFVARDGGRQVVPDRREPAESAEPPESAEPAETTEAAAAQSVPGPRQAEEERADSEQH